jgi:hypothetical protein
VLFENVVRYYDCSILEGHRGKADQDKAVAEGKSKTPWPRSKHNSLPSMAVDAAPYPIDWTDLKRFYHFAGFVLGMAASMGLRLRWGGDWDGDRDLNDQSSNDLPHFEIMPEK